MRFRIAHLDHIHIAAAPGCEAAARKFYGALLGMLEIAKHEVLLARGGCCFECGAQQLHIGVEPDFCPAKTAHPAFLASDLDELRQALLARAINVTDDASVPSTCLFYAEDPWSNRLEFLKSRPPKTP
jgi:catechol 2,3-dioxygenase-like lactoylglutathione lyase family enzyme